jgi:hypothetical protein
MTGVNGGPGRLWAISAPHTGFRGATVVCGRLHTPRTTRHDGVRFEEVSVGYPRERRKRTGPPGRLRRILPALPGTEAAR